MFLMFSVAVARSLPGSLLSSITELLNYLFYGCNLVSAGQHKHRLCRSPEGGGTVLLALHLLSLKQGTWLSTHATYTTILFKTYSVYIQRERSTFQSCCCRYVEKWPNSKMVLTPTEGGQCQCPDKYWHVYITAAMGTPLKNVSVCHISQNGCQTATCTLLQPNTGGRQRALL